MTRAELCALRRAEDHVGAQVGDSTRAQLAEDTALDQVTLVPAERIDSGPVASTEHDVPEPVRVIKVMAAWDGRDGRALHPAPCEQLRQRGLGSDLIPRTERPEQRRVDFAHRLPEDGIGGLE